MSLELFTTYPISAIIVYGPIPIRFKYILNIISPGHNFTSRLLELIQSCPLVDLKEMGFPVDWKNEKLWSNN